MNRSITSLLLLALSVSSACSSAPPPKPAEEAVSVEARLKFLAGESAYRELDIRRAIPLLHQAVHLDRSNARAQDLLQRASWVVGCGPLPPPCAGSFFDGRPDPWRGLGDDLRLHVAVSKREADWATTQGDMDEADDFARCARDLDRLLSE